MDKAKALRITRRAFIGIGAGAAIGGVAGWKWLGRATPDMELSIGSLPPDQQAQAAGAADRWREFENLNILRQSELDRLPWFEKDETGRLCLRKDAGIGPIVDPHAHVGWAFGLGGSVDMRSAGKVEYFYDYQKTQDLLFAQKHPSNDEAAQIARENIKLFLKTPRRNRTHTAANLLAEMDRMNCRDMFLLPIAPPRQSRHVRDTLEAAKLDSRLHAFGAVYPKPWGPDKVADLERQVSEYHIKAVKYHPVFQLVAPDDAEMMKLFEWCQERDILVYSHIGYTGKEPQSMRARSEPDRFVVPLKTFPKLRVVFAHTGVRRVDQTLAVARRFDDRVWLDISGQAAPAISYILRRYNADRVMFASDWPFMPISVMLARSLVATESCPDVRTRFFSENAKQLFGLA
ncbi:MAG TPA: amidohydrolase family protein [Candidatus Brocadiia bacterium]|nr:amidohydrolase family protein [Candidatus Brocadiia bacterium]